MSERRVLVTGSSGFVGTHLCELLRAERVEVATIEHARLQHVEAVTEALAALRPTHIIHLAGISDGTGEDGARYYEAHLLTTGRLLDAARRSSREARIVIASSSAVYGATTPEENPLAEDRPLRPVTPYGVSKVAQEMAALQAHLAHQVWTVRVRTFNLIGPGQPPHLLVSGLARQVAQAEGEGQPITVRVGNLTPRRDYTDVRDAARAYLLLAERGEPGAVYNVCAGRSTSVQECVELLARVAEAPVHVVQDEARRRRCEIPDQIGDSLRLERLTGWRPRIPLEQSVCDLFEEWRERVRMGKGVHA